MREDFSLVLPPATAAIVAECLTREAYRLAEREKRSGRVNRAQS